MERMEGRRAQNLGRFVVCLCAGVSQPRRSHPSFHPLGDEHVQHPSGERSDVPRPTGKGKRTCGVWNEQARVAASPGGVTPPRLPVLPLERTSGPTFAPRLESLAKRGCGDWTPPGQNSNLINAGRALQTGALLAGAEKRRFNEV